MDDLFCECDDCDGTGAVFHHTAFLFAECRTCDGTGEVPILDGQSLPTPTPKGNPPPNGVSSRPDDAHS